MRTFAKTYKKLDGMRSIEGAFRKSVIGANRLFVKEQDDPMEDEDFELNHGGGSAHSPSSSS